MAIEKVIELGPSATDLAPIDATSLAELDASKLTINLAKTLKNVPPSEELVFGQTMTDHMLIANFDPINGWSAPEIKPYGPLTLDPASSCFQYCPNVFEGMKAYLGPDGKPRLFRPQKNMERLTRSAGRVALPPFNTDQLLILIKRLVAIESRWIPTKPGFSLYIRPTIIGTRPALGVAASDSACLYVILSPSGPYLGEGSRPIGLLAGDENVRAWPGGTGSYKLGLNYAPCFMPQSVAAKQGYEQILWLLGENKLITEGGSMNFVMVVKRDDGGVDLITPKLDGTILPGITRDSVLALSSAHTAGKITLPGVSPSLHIHPQERQLTMRDFVSMYEAGKVLEVFGVGTAVIVAPIGRIGFEGRDLVLPKYEAGWGPVGGGLWQTLTDIQVGKLEFEGWSVVCE